MSFRAPWTMLGLVPNTRGTPFVDSVDFWATIAPDVAACDTVADAAQLFCDRFYATYSSFAVLVRLFVTLPCAALGPGDRAFVDDFMQTIADVPLAEDTVVLGLAGTHGIERAWCARETSRDHRAIPLLSQEFVAEIPMIARLLTDIGFATGDVSAGSWQFVARDASRGDGLFFVGDARTATDERGRRIIPAIDFVERYGIRTVFGFGGAYESSPSTYITAIVFARTALERTVAEQFLSLAKHFKEATSGCVSRGAML